MVTSNKDWQSKPGRKRVIRSSVGRRFFGVVDDKHVDRILG